MILPPDAKQMIGQVLFREKGTIKFNAVGNPHRKKKKITGGDKPGERAEKPQTKMLRKISCYAIRKFFHKYI
jgi:hypothetical protein